MDLAGRRILVTGASSGIGAATTRALSIAGATVALTARDPERLAAVAADCGDAPTVPMDVTDPAAVSAGVDEAADALGGLDGLVNSAGLAVPGGLRDGDPAAWAAMFDVNVLGLLAVTRAALPHLEQAPVADVVNVSSMSGRRVGGAALGVYAGTKHAVHAISQAMAMELAGSSVRITVVAPGYVDTPIFVGVDEADDYRERTAALGLAPEQVAAQVVHVVGQPAGVRLVEVAMISTRQG